MRPRRAAVFTVLCAFLGLFGAARAQASLGVPPFQWAITATEDQRVKGATGVVFSEGLLYVTSYSETSGDSTLSVVDPTSHAIVGSVTDARLDGAASLAVDGDYAYVTGLQNRTTLTNANRLTVVDVSDPESPAIVGSVQDDTQLYGAYGVQVVGDLAYVAAQGCVPKVCTTTTVGNRLAIVDVSDRSNPQVIGTAAEPTGATSHLSSIAVAGNRAYGTAFNTETLTVFDITDPAQPAIIGRLRDSLLANNADVVVRGRYAYAIDQNPINSRLVVLDIADPVHPTIVGSVLDTTNLGGGYWLKLVGDHVFVAAAGSDALTVVDVSDPSHPVVVASASDPSALGAADGIDVAGGMAYVAAFCSSALCEDPSGALSAFDVTPYTALDFTAGPVADDSSNLPSLSFEAAVPSEALTCSFDGAPAAPCSSPFVPAAPLAAGPHSLKVSTASDSATWSWTLDAPTITSPTAGATSSDPTPTFAGVAGTRPGDVNAVTVAIYPGASVAGSPVQSLSTQRNQVSGAYSVEASSALAPGTYTARASQSNTAGATATSLPVTFSVSPSPEPGPGPTPEPGPETKTEAVSVTVTTSGATYSRRQAKLILACFGPHHLECQGTLRLSLPGGKPIGSAPFSFDAGDRQLVRITLNGAGRAAVARAAGRRLRVRASVVLEGAVTSREVRLAASK